MKRAAPDESLRLVASTRMPTRWGEFQTIGFEREITNRRRRIETALAMAKLQAYELQDLGLDTDVRGSRFPEASHTYTMPKSELELFENHVR
jgi:GTP cyclohydrolase II